jgi:hypothetical protein
LGGLDGTLARHPQPGAGNQNGGNDGKGNQKQAKSHHIALAGSHRHQQHDEAD